MLNTEQTNAKQTNTENTNTENTNTETTKFRRLTPASHVQVAVRAMDAILKFDYVRFETEAGYKAQELTPEQLTKTQELKNKLEEFRAEFGHVRTSSPGKSLKERLTSVARIIKSMNKGLKKSELKQAVIDSYSEVYGGVIVGHEDLLDEIINNIK